MPELTKQTTHYIVHMTGNDPVTGKSTYGTASPEHSGEHALERAIQAAYMEIMQGRRAFVTARDKDSAILAVIPVVDYPVAQETHVPHHAQDAIHRLFDDMDWTP